MEYFTHRVAPTSSSDTFSEDMQWNKNDMIASCILSKLFFARVSLSVFLSPFCLAQCGGSLHDTVAVRPYIEIPELREEQLTFRIQTNPCLSLEEGTKLRRT